MATTERVKEALDQFLAGDQPGVFAIKGAWGVGKTYFWHHYFEHMKAAKNCRAYTYISLFGITSVAELRRAIFTRASAHGGGSKALLTNAVKSGSLLLRAVKGGTQGAHWKLEGTDMWSSMVEEHGLQHFLVCIDDLERKEKNLSASALLGFITNLRDERKCKVVLLYNDDEIDGKSDTREFLEAYREKVFDRELTYQPTVQDSYHLVFGSEYQFKVEKERTSNPFHQSEKRSLLEIFSTAKTTNIRVMRKAKDLLDYCSPQMADKYHNLWPSFSRQAVKVCCLHYIHGREFKIEDVLDVKKWVRIRNDLKGNELARYEPVNAVGYFQMGCDPLILEYLRSGLIDWIQHAELLTEQEEEHARSHLGMKLGAIWDLIWDDFTVEQATFNQRMNAFLDRYGRKLSIGELSQAVEMVREFGGSNDSAEALLSSRINEAVEKKGEDALKLIHFKIVADDTGRRIRKLVDDRVVSKSIAEVIETMGERNSYTPGEEKYLKNYTEEDFYQYIKGVKGPSILARLNTFRGRISNDKVGQLVRKRFENALVRLWNEGAINRRRLRFGLDFISEEPGQPKPSP